MQDEPARILALTRPVRWPVRDPSGRETGAWLIRDVPGDVDLAAFDANGIACPPEIRRSVPARQAEYLHGRWAARHGLQELGVASVDVHSGPHRQPVWPPGIVGSITHSRHHAAALVLRRTPVTAVGIDLEGVAAGSALEALLQTVVDAAELALLRDIDATLSLAALVTLAFSAKESFFKAAFDEVGRYFDFSAVRVRAVDLAQGHLTLEVREALSDDLVPGRVRVVSFEFLDATLLFTACLW